jgi:DNA-binding response OmpR family regulator
MNHKVLLADDSLTIQKVIKITLANQPYDITDCSNEEELFHQLSAVKPKLVFLDFNLSEKYTGYELTSKIKSISPTTKVLLLLGTFDTVDDNAMEKAGASDKIVKPFDSNKFIAICRHLIDTFADEEIDYPEDNSGDENNISENPDDQWTVSHSTEHKLEKSQSERSLDNSFPNLKNPLMQEMNEWGISVPGVINEEASQDKMVDIPPVIGGETRAQKYPQKFPENNDLDYPSTEEVTDTQAQEKPEKSDYNSKLISIDNFKDDSSELELEGSYVPEETDVSKIEEQIRDEVEENLWQVDEFEDLKKEVASKIEEVKNNFQPTKNDFDDSLFNRTEETGTIDWEEPTNAFKSVSTHDEVTTSSVDKEELRKEMSEMVKKYVKEYMDEMFKKNAEKVAWEVIPDLAENLIRQELSKISNKIMDEES